MPELSPNQFDGGKITPLINGITFMMKLCIGTGTKSPDGSTSCSGVSW
jgi:hypothetical protein